MYIPYILALAIEAPDGASSSEVSAARYLGDGNVGKRLRCVGGRPSTYGTPRHLRCPLHTDRRHFMAPIPNFEFISTIFGRRERGGGLALRVGHFLATKVC
jgi:hypothetical protein